jgi:hypothetical protein
MVRVETRDNLPSLPADRVPGPVAQRIDEGLSSVMCDFESIMANTCGKVVMMPKDEYRHAIRAIRRDGFYLFRDDEVCVQPHEAVLPSRVKTDSRGWTALEQAPERSSRLVMRDGEVWDTERSDGRECLVQPQETVMKLWASRGVMGLRGVPAAVAVRPRPALDLNLRLWRLTDWGDLMCGDGAGGGLVVRQAWLRQGGGQPLRPLQDHEVRCGVMSPGSHRSLNTCGEWPGRYCSRECQRLHWRQHKASCAEPAQRLPRSLLGSDLPDGSIAITTIVLRRPDEDGTRLPRFLRDVDG